MKKAYITVGISGSGKSTWANAQSGFEIIERDLVRKHIAEENGWDTSTNLWSFWKFNKENENKVTQFINRALNDCIDRSVPIICSDTNLNPKYRNELISKLTNAGYYVEVKHFPIDFMEAIKRDEKRKDTVGHDVIYKQYTQYLEQTNRMRYVPDISKPSCIIVDVDGTLAHMNGKRGPFDWDKVKVDDVDEHVTMVVRGLPSSIHTIVLSGRDGSCRVLTSDWLNENGIIYDELIMRAPGDMRKDSIIKEELFWAHIAPKYNCLFVIDDRPQVCRMWRELGLKVFQVGDPHVEF